MVGAHQALRCAPYVQDKTHSCTPAWMTAQVLYVQDTFLHTCLDDRTGFLCARHITAHLLGRPHGRQAIYLIKEDNGRRMACSLLEQQAQLALSLPHPACDGGSLLEGSSKTMTDGAWRAVSSNSRRSWCSASHTLCGESSQQGRIGWKRERIARSHTLEHTHPILPVLTASSCTI